MVVTLGQITNQICQKINSCDYPSDKNRSEAQQKDVQTLYDMLTLAMMLGVTTRATGDAETKDTLTYYGVQLSGIDPNVQGAFDTYMEVATTDPNLQIGLKLKKTIINLCKKELSAEAKKQFGIPLTATEEELHAWLDALTSEKMDTLNFKSQKDAKWLPDLKLLVKMLEVAKNATGDPATPETLTYFGMSLTGVPNEDGVDEVVGGFDDYMTVNSQGEDRLASIKIKLTIAQLWEKLSPETKKIIGEELFQSLKGDEVPMEATTAAKEKFVATLKALCTPPTRTIPTASVTAVIPDFGAANGQEQEYEIRGQLFPKNVTAFVLKFKVRDESGAVIDQAIRVEVPDATIRPEIEDYAKMTTYYYFKVNFALPANAVPGTYSFALLDASEKELTTNPFTIKKFGPPRLSFLPGWLEPQLNLTFRIGKRTPRNDEPLLQSETAESVTTAPAAADETTNLGQEANPNIGISTGLDATIFGPNAKSALLQDDALVAQTGLKYTHGANAWSDNSSLARFSSYFDTHYKLHPFLQPGARVEYAWQNLNYNNPSLAFPAKKSHILGLVLPRINSEWHDGISTSLYPKVRVDYFRLYRSNATESYEGFQGRDGRLLAGGEVNVALNQLVYRYLPAISLSHEKTMIGSRSVPETVIANDQKLIDQSSLENVKSEQTTCRIRFDGVLYKPYFVFSREWADYAAHNSTKASRYAIGGTDFVFGDLEVEYEVRTENEFNPFTTKHIGLNWTDPTKILSAQLRFNSQQKDEEAQSANSGWDIYAGIELVKLATQIWGKKPEITEEEATILPPVGQAPVSFKNAPVEPNTDTPQEEVAPPTLDVAAPPEEDPNALPEANVPVEEVK